MVRCTIEWRWDRHADWDRQLRSRLDSKLLEFVQFPAFLRDWRRLGLGDDALRVLEQEIMDSPDKGPVIEHSGGLRKMRFSPPESRKGKRGAFRVCYAYYPQFGSVALFVVFGKNDRDDVSPSEATAIAKALKTFETELRRQFERLR